ncbi:MAG: methyltransferase domain-containing protein [Candidatus Solibacter sp.]
MPRDWDQHYSDAANIDRDPSPLLVHVAGLLPPGRALDLACGTGRHALHLAQLGWQVTAVDASPAAIRQLRRAVGPHTTIDAHLADLAAHEFVIEPGAYDLICDFYYLQLDLFPSIREGVRPGGAFAGAIHLPAPGRSSGFALESGALRQIFSGWKIVYYSEAAEPGHSRPAARILARRA